MSDSKPKCTKLDIHWGPIRWGSLQRSLDPLAVFKAYF